MAVGLGRQNAPILVSKPACDGLEVHSGFDRVAAEEVAQVVVGEVGEVEVDILVGWGEAETGGCTKTMSNVTIQFLNQCMQNWITKQLNEVSILPYIKNEILIDSNSIFIFGFFF